MEMEEDMLPEESLVCVELYSMQFIRLSPNEQLKLSEMVDRTLRAGMGNGEGMSGQSLGLSGEVEGVGVESKRRNVSLKRKWQSLKSSPALLPQSDGYVAPPVPPVRGMACLIKECTSPFEKQLTVSDLKDDQSRLAFSKHDAEKFLLPFVKGMNLKSGVSTTVYDMEGNSYPMLFKNWCGKYYVLTSGWKVFYKSHDLKPLEDFVTVWMFRHGETKKICFAMSSRRRNVDHLIKKSRSS